MKGQRIGYVRVSSFEQDTERKQPVEKLILVSYLFQNGMVVYARVHFPRGSQKKPRCLHLPCFQSKGRSRTFAPASDSY